MDNFLMYDNGKMYVASEQCLFDNFDSFDANAYKESLLQRSRKYIGMNVPQIEASVGVSTDAKHKIRLIMDKCLGYNKVLSDLSKVFVRSFVYFPKYGGEQHLSFPTFKMRVVKHMPWEYSYEYDIVKNYDILMLLFKNNVDNPKVKKKVDWDKNTYLSNAFFFRLSESEVSEFGNVYNRTQQTIQNGIVQWPVLTPSGKIIKANNLPKPFESSVAHVRPHGSKKKVEVLGNNEVILQQSFWLNSEFIKKVISAHDDPVLFKGF